MKPSEIHALLKQAQIARISSPAGIHTFALYWITWEAYRTRMLAVAARLRGWRIEDAYRAISCKKISTQKTYRECFKDVTGVQLAEQSGIIASVFNQFDAIEVLRHRLIHGYRGANPELIQAASQFIDAVLTQHEKVFGKLQIPLHNGDQMYLGNVLAQRPATGKSIPIAQDYDALIERFGLSESRKSGKSIDVTLIQKLEKLTDSLIKRGSTI